MVYRESSIFRECLPDDSIKTFALGAVLHAEGGQNADRAMAEGVQYLQAPQLAGLPAASPGGFPIGSLLYRAGRSGEFGVESLLNFGTKPGGRSLGSGNSLVNNSSIVLRLEYGNHSFLFMGDAEGKKREGNPNNSRYVEKFLLDNIDPAKLRSTVIKIAHHGSETSSTTSFIQAVNPEIVVVQSGRKSFRGTFIPDASTLRRYCCHNSNIRIYRTDQNDEEDGLTGVGAADGDHIVIRTNGSSMEVEALEGGNPFQVGSCQPSCSL